MGLPASATWGRIAFQNSNRSCIGIQFSFAPQSATINCTCPVPMSPRMRFPSRYRMRSPGSAPVSSHSSVRGSSVTVRWSGLIWKPEFITIWFKCLFKSDKWRLSLRSALGVLSAILTTFAVVCGPTFKTSVPIRSLNADSDFFSRSRYLNFWRSEPDELAEVRRCRLQNSRPGGFTKSCEHIPELFLSQPHVA